MYSFSNAAITPHGSRGFLLSTATVGTNRITIIGFLLLLVAITIGQKEAHFGLGGERARLDDEALGRRTQVGIRR
jgi:hypothetical protein